MHFTTLFGLCLVVAILLITQGELPAVQAQFMRFPMMGMGFPMMGYRGFGMRPGFGRGFYG